MSAIRNLALASEDRTADLDTGSVFFIGNATTLIRYAGYTILTDPTFIHQHERVDIGYEMQSTRLTDPAMEIEDLPPLDFILLSHFHGDHFDQIAETQLDKALPIVTTPEAAEQLAERGFRNTWPLERWSSVDVGKGDANVRVTATPARHGPPVVHMLLPDVMGSVLEFQPRAGYTAFRMYITGDTLVIDDLKDLPRRYSGIDLALLHLGGTRVLGILTTMDAEQGVEMMRIVKPRTAIPIHYDDYDVFTSGLGDFRREVDAAGLSHQVHYLDRGETYQFGMRQ